MSSPLFNETPLKARLIGNPPEKCTYWDVGSNRGPSFCTVSCTIYIILAPSCSFLGSSSATQHVGDWSFSDWPFRQVIQCLRREMKVRNVPKSGAGRASQLALHIPWDPKISRHEMFFVPSEIKQPNSLNSLVYKNKKLVSKCKNLWTTAASWFGKLPALPYKTKSILVCRRGFFFIEHCFVADTSDVTQHLDMFCNMYFLIRFIFSCLSFLVWPFFPQDAIEGTELNASSSAHPPPGGNRYVLVLLLESSHVFCLYIQSK